MNEPLERLRIRPTGEGDLADLGRLWNDGEVMRWVGFPDGPGYDEQALRRWLDATDVDPHRHHFVVHDRELGFCGEGHGIATARLSWLIDRIFATEPDVDAVWTEPWPENRASRALYARCGLVESDRPDDLRPGPSYWEPSQR